MPASTVFVSHSDGSPCRSCRVTLGFSSGTTNPAFTDSQGQVTIEHASKGKATVYVSGKNCGTFHAPGRTSVVYR